jgi:hypothetical protein
MCRKDQLQNVFNAYDQNGKFLKTYNLGDSFNDKKIITLDPWNYQYGIKYGEALSKAGATFKKSAAPAMMEASPVAMKTRSKKSRKSKKARGSKKRRTARRR